MISDVTTLVILVFLNSNYFLIKVCTFKRLQYGVDITHLCTRKPKKKKKKIMTRFIARLPSCGGVDPNPRGLPVFNNTDGQCHLTKNENLLKTHETGLS